MKTFFKFHGTGNDFIMHDAYNDNSSFTSGEIENLCNRHTGIGADGFIVIKKSLEADFRMIYYNADGKEAEMCGNGARCAVMFAFLHEYCSKNTKFEVKDGLHMGEILKNETNEALIRISLNLNCSPQKLEDNSFFANIGVPHNVRICSNIDFINIKDEGAKHRFNTKLFPNGANINFIELQKEKIKIRTYERGVEDETLSCGTGITAAALIANEFFNYNYPIEVHAKGGVLRVLMLNNVFFLEGMATKVFTTTI